MSIHIDFKFNLFEADFYRTHQLKYQGDKNQLVSTGTGKEEGKLEGKLPKLPDASPEDINRILHHDFEVVLGTIDSLSDKKRSIQKIRNLISNMEEFSKVFKSEDEFDREIETGEKKVQELEDLLSEVEKKEVEEKPAPAKLSKKERKTEEEYRKSYQIAMRTFVKGFKQILTEFKKKGAKEGIFRKSADKPELDKVLKRIRKVNIDKKPEKIDDIVSNITDVHLIAGILKDLIRKIDRPLIDKKAEDLFIECGRLNLGDEVEVITKLEEALSEMPPENRKDLVMIARFLNSLSEYHGKETKMNDFNLALVWAPNFIKTQDPITFKTYIDGIGALIQYSEWWV